MTEGGKRGHEGGLDGKRGRGEGDIKGMSEGGAKGGTRRGEKPKAKGSDELST